MLAILFTYVLFTPFEGGVESASRSESLKHCVFVD